MLVRTKLQAIKLLPQFGKSARGGSTVYSTSHWYFHISLTPGKCPSCYLFDQAFLQTDVLVIEQGYRFFLTASILSFERITSRLLEHLKMQFFCSFVVRCFHTEGLLQRLQRRSFQKRNPCKYVQRIWSRTHDSRQFDSARLGIDRISCEILSFCILKHFQDTILHCVVNTSSSTTGTMDFWRLNNILWLHLPLMIYNAGKSLRMHKRGVPFYILHYSTLPVLGDGSGIFILERIQNISSDTTCYDCTCTDSLNRTTIISFGGGAYGFHFIQDLYRTILLW